MKSIDEIAKQIREGTSKASTATSSSTESPVSAPVDLPGRADCTLCHGLGYVRLDVPVGHPDFGKLFPCTCRVHDLRERRTQTLRSFSNLAALERFTFERFTPEGHGLPPEKQRNLRQAYDCAREYAQHPQGWLLLIGGYGCGKTHLAAAIANATIARGLPVLFVTVPDLLDHLRAAYAPTSTQPYDERFEQVRTSPLLILDDLGTEHTTPWALEKLFQLLNYRYLSQLPTVITTNQEIEGMDPRLRSRLAEPDLVEMVTILAPDFRQAGVDHRQTDLNALPLYGEMTFDTFDLRQHELDRETADNLARAFKQAQDYAAAPQGWLAFTGTYGCGKTHLAAAIANERVRQGHPALLIVVPDLLDHLRATFAAQSPITYDKRFQEVRHAPLLVLDDLGTESATPWAQEKLFQLLNARYVTRRPTIITTAYALEELDAKLRTRLLDADRCEVFALLASAYRGRTTSRQAPHKRGRRS